MYSVRDLTKRFGVGERTVLDWILSGQLRAINVGRSAAARKPRWRVTEKAVADFESVRTTAAPPPPPSRKRRKRSSEVIEFYQ